MPHFSSPWCSLTETTEACSRSSDVLTVSTASRFIGEAARAWSGSIALAWIIVIGGIGQVIGAGVYFRAVWPRIRPVGSHVREAQGERF